MNTTKTFLFISDLVVSALVLGAVLVSAETKPNFSGTWELNVAKSDLGGAPITRLVVQVEHKDPVFKYIAKGTADGQDIEEIETFTTDGKPSTDSRGAKVIAHWDGAMLAIETTGGDGKALEDIRLTLSSDGKTLARVYERKSTDDPQKRHDIFEKQ